MKWLQPFILQSRQSMIQETWETIVCVCDCCSPLHHWILSLQWIGMDIYYHYYNSDQGGWVYLTRPALIHLLVCLNNPSSSFIYLCFIIKLLFTQSSHLIKRRRLHLFSLLKLSALWAERSLARYRYALACTWHAIGTAQACHHFSTHMPRCATLVPPLCLWQANLMPMARPSLRRSRRAIGVPIACHPLYSTITVFYCNASPP